MEPSLKDKNPKDYYALDEATPTLPSAWYYDPEHYQLELEMIWRRQWIYLCRADALSEPGAYQALSIGDQHVFVMRTASGKLAGYYNSCRHRGSVLVTEQRGKLRAKTINCPYHNWCYSTEDGSLVATSSFCDPAGFDKREHGLAPISVHNWRGCVFVHFDPDAEWDVSAFYDDSMNEVANFPLEDMVIGAHWSKTLTCNWKAYWDNYNECLHCPHVHPELVSLVPIYKRGLLHAQDRPDWRNHVDDPDPKYRGGLRTGAETWSKDGTAQGHVIESLTKEELEKAASYADFPPSVYMTALADHVRIVRILPLGPEKMELQMECLFTKEALDDPNYDTSNVVDVATTVLKEDGQVSELNQRGMHAKPFREGVLMPEEYSVKAFQDWVRAQLARAGVI